MNKSKFNRVIDMTRQYYKFMVSDLRHIQTQIDESCRGPDDDEPSIDVRLCIDFQDDGTPDWIIRSGDSSYDQRHSALCGASIVSLDTEFNDEADETLENLIDQCLEQMTMAGES